MQRPWKERTPPRLFYYTYTRRGQWRAKNSPHYKEVVLFTSQPPIIPANKSDLHTIFHLILILDSSKNKMNVLFPYPHLTLHSSSASSTVTLFLTPSLSPSVLAPTSAAVGSAELGAGEDTSTPPACPCPCLALPDADPDPDLCFLVWV